MSRRDSCLSEETLLGIILDEEFLGRTFCEWHLSECPRCQAEVARLQDDIEEANRQERPYKSRVDRFLEELEEQEALLAEMDPASADLSLV